MGGESSHDGISIHLRGVAQMKKHLPTMWEIRVRSLGQEDPLEKEMATHSSTLAWKIPWTEEPGRLQSMGSQKLDMTERLHFTSLHFTSLQGTLGKKSLIIFFIHGAGALNERKL